MRWYRYVATVVLWNTAMGISTMFADDFVPDDSGVFETSSEFLTLDSSDSAGAGETIYLQFGTSLAERISWDIDSSRFELSDQVFIDGDLQLGGTQIILDEDNVGVGNSVSIIASQGSDVDGELRYDATNNRWERSNDGGPFEELQAFSTDRVVQVYDNSGGTNVNSGSLTSIPFNAQTLVGSDFTHSTSVNSSRVAMNNTGWYKATYNVSFASQTNGRKTVRCLSQRNGTTLVPSASYGYARNSNDDKETASSTFLFEVTTPGQYIEVRCQEEGSGGDADTIAGETWLYIERIE